MNGQALENLRTIEGIIMHKSIEFQTLIATRGFISAYSTPTPVIIDFLMANIGTLLSCAFGVDCDPKTSGVAVFILSSPQLYPLKDSQIYHDFILTSLRNFDYFSVKMKALLCRHISCVYSFVGASLISCIGPAVLINALIQKLKFDPIFELLKTFVASFEEKCCSTFDESGLVGQLCEQYLANGSTDCLRLLTFGIQTLPFCDFEADRIYVYFHSLISKIIRENCVEGMKLLYFILLLTKSGRLPAFVRIYDEIVANFDTITNELTRCTTFSKKDLWPSKMFLAADPHKEALIDVSVHALELFFSNPTNSILHNFSLSCLKSASKNGTAMERIISLSQIEERIKRTLLSRGSLNASFWGHINEMSKLISSSKRKSYHTQTYVQPFHSSQSYITTPGNTKVWLTCLAIIVFLFMICFF